MFNGLSRDINAVCREAKTLRASLSVISNLCDVLPLKDEDFAGGAHRRRCSTWRRQCIDSHRHISSSNRGRRVTEAIRTIVVATGLVETSVHWLANCIGAHL